MSQNITIKSKYSYKILSILACIIVFFIIYDVFIGVSFSLIALGIIMCVCGFNSYRYIILNSHECVFKPWIGENKIFLIDDLKYIQRRVGDSDILTFTSNSENGTVDRSVIVGGYEVENSVINETSSAIQEIPMLVQEVEKFALQYDIPFETINEKKMSDIKIGKSLRFIIYPAVIVFMGMMYVDMKVLTGVHFDTMNFMIPTVCITLCVCILCYLFFTLTQEKNVIMYTLVSGIALGLLFSSVTKSYIHWYDENRAHNIVKYYPMKLDDYDSYTNEQRWIIQSNEAEDLIEQKRLFLFGVKRDRIMNSELIEGSVYSVPVAVGMFNDVFIPQDGFENAKLKTN